MGRPAIRFLGCDAAGIAADEGKIDGVERVTYIRVRGMAEQVRRKNRGVERCGCLNRRGRLWRIV